MEEAIIVFQKKAEPGKVKTRLAKSIGKVRAAQVYAFLLDHTYNQLEPLDADIFIFYQGELDKERDLKGNYFTVPQKGNNLGEKMSNAFDLVLAKGYERVLIIGTDCYELGTKHIDDGFQGLKENDLVIGPACDGGYYLLGMKRFYPSLFENMTWSNSKVFERTMGRARELNLSTCFLPVLNDVDTYEDLGELKELLDLRGE